MNKKQLKKFESFLPCINVEIEKRRSRWLLNSITWMDFDDVSQILKMHIFQKWSQYDATKPIEPWLNRIISNQIKNIVRNNYSNYTKPCLKCAAALPDGGCSVYKTQSDQCKMFKKWYNKKRDACEIKMPLSIENHEHEIHDKQVGNYSNEEINPEFHKKIKSLLKSIEWIVYESIYINNESESKVAKKLGLKTSEKNRSPGYRQIKNITKSIVKKIKKAMDDGDLDIY